jgi:CheY-like chemotaxis protein
MRTDSLKVKQILINLVSNALKFTREGEITIVANPIPSPTGDDAAWLQLEVRDTGVGIPKDKLDRLFKIFSQVDNRISREYEGIGLGLYISQYLAQMLGGDISVTSEVGRGTTFIVRLPVELENVGVVRRLAQLSKATVNAAEPLSVQPEPVTLAPGQQCVLVIGTSPDLARLLGDSLKKEGLQALKATSYETALKAITDAKPQAVFVDLTHSQSEAWQILQQLRLHPDAQNLPVIYLTDYGEAPPASGAGAPLAVTAPLQPQQVVDSVRKAGNQNTKILVADDEDSFRSVLETILRDEGYQVSLAKDGREALEKLERERPHVLLLDLNMPVMSGWEVIRAICDKPAVRDTRVVIMTGQVMSDEDTKLISQNIQGFLKKSEFRIEKILAEVRAVMQNA